MEKKKCFMCNYFFTFYLVRMKYKVTHLRKRTAFANDFQENLSLHVTELLLDLFENSTTKL